MPVADKKLLEKLVTDFDAKKRSGEITHFLEADIKQHYISPFWTSLGWDMQDSSQVRMEVPVRMTFGDEQGIKHIDYLFFTKKKPVMVVEAKTSGNVLTHPAFIFQTKSYGYSKTIDISVLFNFEHFAPFDTGLFPKYDQSMIGLIRNFNLTYQKYLERFDDLCSVFSFEAVNSGSLLNVLPEARRLINKESIDRRFLEQLGKWRDKLAKAIFKNNHNLNADDLNEAVQRILDRIIFIRVLEDRKIEQFHYLLDAQTTWLQERRDRYAPTLYEHIVEKFKTLRERYNGQIFGPAGKPPHFSERLSLPDEDMTLRTIIDHLYGRNCPYAFGEIPIEILGKTYEKFLGSTIIFNDIGKPVLGDKPGLKKGQGVYYTPKWVVDYIVERTVGVLLKDKTPAEVSKLRVVDPACGSGSFLIGAYERICSHLEDWFTAHPEKISKKEPECWLSSRENRYRMTAKAKIKVAVENIYGVDLDPQAVELTQMSLYIKMLEDVEALDLFSGSLLPDLSQNIRCGNSLIGPDYKTEKDKRNRLYWAGDLDSLKHIKPFNWESEFQRVFEQRGFDAVIGNPPYVRQESLSSIKEYLAAHYTAFTSLTDLYIAFIEKGLSLLKQGGRFGYIVSNKWMRTEYGKGLRTILLNQFAVEEMVDFGELPVFEDAATFPVIIIIKNGIKENPPIYVPVKSLEFDDLSKLVSEIGFPLPITAMAPSSWSLVQSDKQAILDKMKAVGVPLGEIVKGKIHRGVLTGLNKAFIIDREKRDELISADSKSIEIIKPLVIGDDVRKYRINFCDRYLILTKIGVPIKQYPAIFEHLKQYKTQLEKRCDKGDHWWELRACAYYDEFEKPKIVWPEIAMESRFGFDNRLLFFIKTCFIMPSDNLVLLSILNSKPVWNFLKALTPVLGDAEKRGRLTQQAVYISQIPIRLPDTSIPKQAQQDKRLKELAELIMVLNRRLHGELRQDGSGKWAMPPTINDADKALLKREIDAAELEVDDIVADLYGLTNM